MKFQNPSFNFFLTDGQTNGRTDKPKAICSPLFQSWGHNKKNPSPNSLKCCTKKINRYTVADSEHE